MEDPSRLCQAVVEECFTKGLQNTLSSSAVQDAVVEMFHSFGCPKGLGRVAAWVLGGLGSYGLALGGGRFERALEDLILRVPPLQKGFAKLLSVAQRCSDEAELKGALLASLQTGDSVALEATPHASLDVVATLFSARQFERLSKELQDGLAALREAVRGQLAEADESAFGTIRHTISASCSTMA